MSIYALVSLGKIFEQGKLFVEDWRKIKVIIFKLDIVCAII